MPDEKREAPATVMTMSPDRQRRQAPGRTTSAALLGAARELIIEHGGREYRLRVTQQGKLILTA